MISGVNLSSIWAILSFKCNLRFFKRCNVSWSAVPLSLRAEIASSKSRCSLRNTSNSMRSTSSFFIAISDDPVIQGPLSRYAITLTKGIFAAKPLSRIKFMPISFYRSPNLGPICLDCRFCKGRFDDKTYACFLSPYAWV